MPENITSLLPSILLQVFSTSNNANGNKPVIFFRYSLVLWWWGFYHTNLIAHSDQGLFWLHWEEYLNYRSLHTEVSGCLSNCTSPICKVHLQTNTQAGFGKKGWIVLTELGRVTAYVTSSTRYVSCNLIVVQMWALTILVVKNTSTVCTCKASPLTSVHLCELDIW